MFKQEWFKRPEVILSDLLKDFANSSVKKLLYRASVVAVDPDGGKLQNKNGNGYTEFNFGNKVKKINATVGLENPAMSIKARILTDGLDRLIDDNDLKVYWPLFQHSQMSCPIVPGEHVFILFEDESLSSGLWVCRIPTTSAANISAGSDLYDHNDEENSIYFFTERNKKEKINDSYAGLAPTDLNSPIKLFNGE